MQKLIIISVVVILLSCFSLFLKPNAWFVPFVNEEIKNHEMEFTLEEGYVYDIYLEKGKPARVIIENELYPFNEKNGRLFKKEDDAKKFYLYLSIEKTKKKLGAFFDEDVQNYNNNFMQNFTFKNFVFPLKTTFSLPSSFGDPIEKIIPENKIDQTNLEIKSSEYISNKSEIIFYNISDYKEMIKKSGLENDKKNFEELLKKINSESKIKKEFLVEPSLKPKKIYSYIYSIKNPDYIGYYYISLPVSFDEKPDSGFQLKYLLIYEKYSIVISASISIESIFLNKLNMEIKDGTIKINSENEIPAFTDKLLAEKSMLSNYAEVADKIIKSISFDPADFNK